MIKISLIRQGLVRSIALSIPLLLLNIIRIFYDIETQSVFFNLITVVVPLSIFLKFGLDIALPRSGLTNESKLVIDKNHLILVLVINIIFLLIGILSTDNPFIKAPLCVVPIIVSCYIYAEISRAKSRYLIFYIFKAPIVYCVAFFYAVFLMQQEFAVQNLTFVALFVTSFILVMVHLHVSNEVTRRFKISVFITSLLMQLFIWKESLFSLVFLNSESLIELTTYGRYKVIITFVFISFNSTIPNLIRNQKIPITAEFLSEVNSKVSRLSLIWAVVSYILICVFTIMIFPNELFVAAGILLCAIISIIFGNISMILNCLGHEKQVFIAFCSGFVLFNVFAFLLAHFSALPTTVSVVVSALVAQLILSLSLKHSFSVILKQM